MEKLGKPYIIQVMKINTNKDEYFQEDGVKTSENVILHTNNKDKGQIVKISFFSTLKIN